MLYTTGMQGQTYSPHVSKATSDYTKDPFKILKVRIDAAASGCPGPSYILCRKGRKNTSIICMYNYIRHA